MNMNTNQHQIHILHIARYLLITTLVFNIIAPSMVQAGPASSNYQLKDYGFGSGGSQNSSSTNYNMFGISGETSGDKSASTNNKTLQGLVGTTQANVPPAPSFTNPAHYYNKLKLVLDTGNNSSDATYAIAISTDNFLSDTKYVQSDNTIGTTLGSEDWQTYTAWGSASGIYVIGLTPGTTYTVKVEAERGNFTQTGFGPTAQALTDNPSLTFDIDVAPTDTETAAPYSLNIGDLTAGSVVTASDKVWVDVDTNGSAGATVYVQGANGGLASTDASYTISSVSGNLSSSNEGYGAQGSSVAESTGGPLEITSPYNGSSDVVGPLDTTRRIIFDSSGTAITSGRGSFTIKAKASAVTKSASDYNDTLTLIASASF
ncbi:MAG: hypothetical protein K8Q97_04920 [Candidatus Andersenbacteria bacterium]|nr:hypothetical protein [Candidatus Andersenbacteria bacterium]